ncbi:MAG: hypothetical protein J0M16_06855 [Gammaproteobacteria bacterium]|nr:hypothetical protein [Gammaproteobacteria bacterium]
MSTPDRRYPPLVPLSPGFTTDPGDDFRARVQADLAATAYQRKQDLAAQCSEANSPGSRIRIWERLHMTRLPSEPDHCLVALVSARTGLTVAEVQAEQQRRGPPPAPDLSR